MSFLLGATGSLASSLDTKRLYGIEGVSYELSNEHVVILGGGMNPSMPCSDKIYPLLDGHGVLIGKMFDRQSKAAQFNHDQVRRLILDPGQLTKEFWGRYAGIFYNKRDQSITLVRDPVGLSTLYYAVTSKGLLFSTELSFLYDLLEDKPSIDWAHFAERIINTNQALPTTPFIGIKELQPGMGLTFYPDHTIRQQHLWDMAQFGGSFIQNKDAFEEELLTTLKACTEAWVQESAGLCVELSGGADSSALMILLRDILPPEKKLIGVNYVDSKTPSSNEMQYAQGVADQCQAPLFFIDLQKCPMLSPLPESWRPNRPSTFLLYFSMGRQLVDLAAEQGCDGIINGQGGDHVFLSDPGENSIADAWLSQKFKNIPHVISELSSMYRVSWWTLVQKNVKSIMRYYRGIRPGGTYNTPFLDSSFSTKCKLHDFYLQDLYSFYPGKTDQIEGLYQASAYAERNQRIPFYTQTHPLLSQPLIELALKIPSYQSFDEGYDRIFFRRAVSRLKDSKALWRRVKGETTSSLSKDFALNADEIHDILLKGNLLKSGVINRNWLSAEMVKIKHGHSQNLWPVWHMLTCQLWLNQWRL